MDQYSYTPGQTISGTQYRFVRMIGFGAHGTVCVVEHSFLEARAVMKLLHPELATERDIAQRMKREARMLAKLRHPNIVEVRDGGMTAESPPRPYFVMEALAGTTLRDLLKRMPGKGIGVLEALGIMSDVLEGLHHAHAAGVIHRDIKPDNLFLNRTTADQTVPKILDFGIAHLLGGERLTGESVLGTPRYAAPEQLLGERVSGAGDIYAAGLVLWELITGKLPFADKRNFEALLQAHVLEKLPAPSTVTREASVEVDAVVALLTEREPSRRPATAAAAAAALREVRALLAGREREPSDLEAEGYATRPTPLENVLLAASPRSAPPLVETPRIALARPQPHVAADNATFPMTNRPGALEAALQQTRERPAQKPSPLPPPAPESPPPPPEPPPRVEPARESQREPPPPSLRDRAAARPFLLFLVAFAIIAGIGVPLAVTLTRHFMAGRSGQTGLHSMPRPGAAP